MGGSGSGSHYQWWRDGKKCVVEDCLSLDANRWMREGQLKAGIRSSGNWTWTRRNGTKSEIGYNLNTANPNAAFVELSYSVAETPVTYSVSLTSTVPRFGGHRWWFVCPLVVNGKPCGRRVAKLYLGPGSKYFGCRHCHRLTYTSCQESRKFDPLHRIIARNMGADFQAVRKALNRLGKRRMAN